MPTESRQARWRKAGLCTGCGKVAPRPEKTQCGPCGLKAVMYNRRYRGLEKKPAKLMNAAYMREEFDWLVPYGVRFSEIARRLGVTSDQLRSAVAGKAEYSCCDACGMIFRGHNSLCSAECRTARLNNAMVNV